MSGAKSDQVEVERRKKAELERARQERLRQIREATEKLNAEITASESRIDTIDRHLLSLSGAAKKGAEMTVTLTKIDGLKTECRNRIIRALEINVPPDPGAILACVRALANETRETMAVFFRDAGPLEENLRDYNSRVETLNRNADLEKRLATGTGKIGGIEDFNFSAAKDDMSHANREVSVDESAARLLAEIEELANSESIQDSDMKNLLAIAANIYKTAFETKADFEAAVIEYHAVKPRIIRNISDFDGLYRDYYAEYVVWLELVNKSRDVPLTIYPKEKYLFTSIDQLQEELDRLVAESKAVSEKNYIMEQINEVMKSFDYNVAEEIVFDSGSTGNHYICENSSGRAAVHIHLSEKKRIMMEVVGAEKKAGAGDTPEGYAEIIDEARLSGGEKTALLGEQGYFCQLHPKIVEELERRGISFTMLKRNPPDLSHCKMIRYFSASGDLAGDRSELFNRNAGRQDRGRRRSKPLARAIG